MMWLASTVERLGCQFNESVPDNKLAHYRTQNNLKNAKVRITNEDRDMLNPVVRQMHAVVYSQWCDAVLYNCDNPQVAIRNANRQLYVQLFGDASVRLRTMTEAQVRQLIAAREAYINNI